MSVQITRAEVPALSPAAGRLSLAAVPRAVWLFALIYVLAAFLPYAAGYLNAPPGGAFTGNALEQTRVDYNSHLARMQLGLRGEWGTVLLFTPEDHPAALMQPIYAILGNAARIVGLPAEAVFHAARIVFGMGMVVAIWLFAARWLDSPRARWTAFLLATVTGGAGWLLYLIIPAQTATLAPIEFWLIDAYTFLAALTFPHFSLAVILLIGLMLAFDGWLRAPSWRGGLALAAWSLPLGWVQPFGLLLTALLIGGLALWSAARGRLARTRLLMLIPAGLAHAIPVIYHAAALASDSVWRAFSAQNVTLSPPPIYYLFGYAWLLIPAVVGVYAVVRRRDTRFLLPLAWVLLVVALVYAPLQTQRRYLMGVQVPLAVLAAVGLEWLYARWAARPAPQGSRRRGRLLLIAALLLSTLSHVLIAASSALTATPEVRPLLFLSADELSAFAWLRDQPVGAVVLAAFPSGGKIPATTGRRVYLGHWIETMDYDARRRQVAAFFDPAGMTDAERLSLLRDNGIDFVWYDGEARALGSWTPGGAAFLRPAFESDSVTVYEVTP